MKTIVFLFIVFFLCGCKQSNQPAKEELFKVDLEFSEKAGEVGFNTAFIEFAHPEAVLLRENSMPVVGKSAITKLFENVNSEGINFSWKPLSGDIAASGEFGYTYGIFTIKRDTILQKGTYVSIWKKDSTGNWKYILDSGNEGLGKELE